MCPQAHMTTAWQMPKRTKYIKKKYKSYIITIMSLFQTVYIFLDAETEIPIASFIKDFPTLQIETLSLILIIG